MRHRLHKERTITLRRTAAAIGVASAALLVSPTAAHAVEISSLLHQVDETPGLPTPGNPGGSGGTGTPGAPTPGAPQPNYDGPTSVPPPPASVAPIINYVPPSYIGPYTPFLPILQAPRRVAPVPEVKPPPNTIRIGNKIMPIPPGMADSDVRSINRWAAYQEARIATTLVSLGVPREEASRRAASTVLGAAIGGASLGLPSAALGAGLGVVPGMVTGGILAGTFGVFPLTIILTPFLGPVAPTVATPLAIAGGVVAGGAAGAAGGALVLGVPMGLLGMGIGGVLGFFLGAGDPGADPGTVRNPGDPETEKGFELPPPNPKADQYRLTTTVGGVGVKYVVKADGDVEGKLTVGGVNLPYKWSAEVADGPYRALGFLSETGREAVKAWVYSTGLDAVNKIPGLQISYPQSVKPGQTAPTNGRLGQAELDRQKAQNKARDRAIERAQNNGNEDKVNQGEQAPSATPKPEQKASGPRHSAPRSAAAVVPTKRPDPVATVVKQVQQTVNGWTVPAPAVKHHR